LSRLINKTLLSTLLFTFLIISTGSPTLFSILICASASALGAWMFDNMLFSRSLTIKDVVRIIYIARFLLAFIIQEARAHIEMTKIILLRKPIRPAIVAISYDLASEYSETLVALAITNTPGTAVLEVDRIGKIMYVHWINAKTLNPAEARRGIIEAFEKHLKKAMG